MPRAGWKGTSNPKVAYLHVGKAPDNPQYSTEQLQYDFDQGLRDFGYFQANTASFIMYADWNQAKLNDNATLAAANGDVVVAADSLSLEAAVAAVAAKAGKKPPVVMAICGDLAETWHAGKAHGHTNNALKHIQKRLDLLNTIKSATEIAIIYNQSDTSSDMQRKDAESRIKKAKKNYHSYPISPTFNATDDDVRETLEKATKQEAIIVMADPLVSRCRVAIVQAVNAAGIPAIYPHKDFVIDGGLISYGANRYKLMRGVGAFVDDLLLTKKGLANKQPSYVELAVRTNLDIKIPDTIISQATDIYSNTVPSPPGSRFL